MLRRLAIGIMVALLMSCGTLQASARPTETWGGGGGGNGCAAGSISWKSNVELVKSTTNLLYSTGQSMGKAETAWASQDMGNGHHGQHKGGGWAVEE